MAKRKTKRQLNKKRAGTKTESLDRVTLSSIIQSQRYRFAAGFILSCIGLYALIQILPDSFTRPINEHIAAILGLALNFSGIPVSTIHDTVSDGNLAFKIIPECTPIFAAGLFLCFIAFYPATVRQKAAALAMGIPVLYLGNLFRLVIIFIISQHDRSLFEVVHAYLGQVFTILLVIISCLLWLKWIDNKESQQSIPMKATIFLARFAVISGCLFLVWMKIHHGYIWLLDQFTIPAFSLFDYHFSFTQNTVVYYETFSIVTFTSLVLATRSISWVLKIKALAIGLGFLFLTHLFHRIDNALMVYFHFTSAQGESGVRS